MNRTLRRSAALTVVALLVPATAAATSDDVFPITITHVFGETVIPERPERVAGVEWGNHDVALALGVVPVGMPLMTYGDEDGDGILPWAKEALDALGVGDDALPVLFDESDGIAFEQVALVEPDVILSAYSGLDVDEYTTLSAIAPTVAYPERPWFTNWRDMALLNGTALGLGAEAEQLVADLDARIASESAERTDLTGKTVAFLYVDPDDASQITLFNDARVEMLEDFGMVRSAAVTELFPEDEFHVVISAERADVIDADLIAIYGDERTLEQLQSDPLLSTIPAVERGAVAVIIDGSPLASAIGGVTVLSLAWVLDDYLDLFDAAAQQLD